MAPRAFRDLLERTVENLKRFGAEVFSGTLAPSPYRKGREKACEQCDYAAVCRSDAWTQPYRSLTLPDEKEE
jgi:ATP-dependent helicase/DNAse subunit B